MDLIEFNRTATEREGLEQMLDFYRAVLYRKLDGLVESQASLTIPPSPMTLLGLVKHMAAVEDGWFTEVVAGKPMVEPWASCDWANDPDWEWNSALEDSVADTLALFVESCDRSRAVMADVDSLDQIVTSAGGRDFSVRFIVLHMIEETARHAGHADLLRELADGATGD